MLGVVDWNMKFLYVLPGWEAQLMMVECYVMQ
jgi:hypothetical protein